MKPLEKRGVLRTVQAAGKGIVIQITGDGESARRALEMVREKLRETGAEAGHTAEMLERVKGALETVGLYMGIREAIDAIKELTEGSAEFAEQMGKAAVRTGMTVETLSILHYAADLAHTDFDGLQGGIGKLAVNMESAAAGNKKMAAAFNQAGIDAKSLVGQSDGVDIAFKKLAVTLANTESASRRDALAKALMGKAGVELVPVLMDVGKNFDEMAAGADKAGVKLDELRAQKLAALDDDLDKMKESIKGAGLAFTDGLAEPIMKVFEIINQGTGSGNALQTWGENTGKVIARLAALFYDLASAAEFYFSLGEGGTSTSAGTRDYEAYESLLKKGKELEELADGKKDPTNSRGWGESMQQHRLDEAKRRALGAGATPDSEDKGKGVNAIEEARTQLLDEATRVQLAKRKAADQVQLAELEAQHKELLVTDQDFYAEKLRLQLDELDAEAAQLDSKGKNLEDLLAKQHANPALKRGKDGQSAEELKTQRELLQAQEQRAALTAKRGQLTSANDADVVLSQQAAEIAGLRLAAELEKERNSGIEAQIALVKREAEEQAKKVKNAGGTDADVAAVRTTEQLAEQKLRLGEVTRQIGEIEGDYRRKIDDTNDAVSKGDLTKQQGARAIARLQAEEAARLQALVAQYTALAQTLGGEYVQKALDAQAELNKLGRHDRTQDGDYKFAESLKSMTDSIVDSTAQAQQSFSKMAQSILNDIDRMALKFVEQKFINPFFEPGDGSDGGNGMSLSKLLHPFSGGAPAKTAQMWRPPTPSAGGSGAGSAIADIASTAAKGLAPKLTTNLQNNSSQPLQMGEPEISYDDQLGEFVVNYIMNDHATGGPIRQLYGGG